MRGQLIEDPMRTTLNARSMTLTTYLLEVSSFCAETIKSDAAEHKHDARINDGSEVKTTRRNVRH